MDYQDSQREWRWALYAANNSRIADSSNGYRSMHDCKEAIEQVKASGEAVVKDGASELVQRYKATRQDRGRKQH